MEDKKYNLEQAQDEALKLQKKVASGEASSCSEAEEQLENIVEQKTTEVKPEVKKETQESIKITATFEQGQQGPICRKPSDRGAWVVLENASKVSFGTPYIVEITRVAGSGKLRFAKIVETVAERTERTWNKIKEAINDEHNLEAVYGDYGSGKLIIRLPDNKQITLPYDVLGPGYGYRKGFRYGNFIVTSEAITRVWKQVVEKYKMEEKIKKEKRYEENKIQIKKIAEHRAEEVVKDAKMVNQFIQEHPEARSWFQSENLGGYPSGRFPYFETDEERKIYEDHLKELFQKGGADLNLTWNEVSARAKYKTAELESDPRIRKEKEKIMAIAAQPNSENGPLGAWPQARLDQVPDAGALIQVDGKWYVAVTGVRREGTKGNLGGLYSRWVQVPESECKDW